jgi:hypothetical protein
MPQDLEADMLMRLSSWLRRVSKGWVALAGLLIFLLFTALVLPGQSQKAANISGEAGSPDTSFFYSPADLTRMAEAYGEQGRQAYVRARFTFDLIFPIVYTFFLVTSLSWVFVKGFPASSRWQLANLVPLLGMLCDYLENITASFVMLRYPSPAVIAAALAPVFTLLKWSFIGLSFGLLVIGILAGLWKWGKRRSVKNNPE